MSCSFNAGAQRMTLNLGGMNLPVLGYTLSAENAVRELSLVDGGQKRLVLGEREVTLQVVGAVHSPIGAFLPAALQNALAQHTAYSFTFAGAAFTGMRITKMQVQVRDNTRTAAYSITMTGTMSEDSAGGEEDDG